MHHQPSTPPRQIPKLLSAPTTPSEHLKRTNLSQSAPTHKNQRLESNNTTFLMSNSSGKTKKHPRRLNSTPFREYRQDTDDLGTFEDGLIEDEESVLVASPFAYVTPPMPPREDVGNAKTTKAMAKIVGEMGTPDSVIRKLSFLNPLSSAEVTTDNEVESPEPVQVGTVTKGRVRSLDSEDVDDEDFRFPLATPSQDLSEEIGADDDSSSEGFARFSLSLMPDDGQSPPMSPTPVRGLSLSLGGENSAPSTLPDLLVNCDVCGKQFISSKNLEDHSNFCRPAVSAADQPEHRESHMSIASSACDNPPTQPSSAFTESPALPLYVQRAMAVRSSASSTSDLMERADTPVPPPPAVAPLPMTSPSILASPTELRESLNGEDGFEDEISTFLECLKSDLGPLASPTDPLGLTTERQRLWAARRHRSTPSPVNAFSRKASENSLQVSSEDSEEDQHGEAGTGAGRSSGTGSVGSNQLSSINSRHSTASSTGLMFVPLPKPVGRIPSPPPPPPIGPPLALTSNISINSPIQERSSFEIEPSYISASFLNLGASPAAAATASAGDLDFSKLLPLPVRASAPSVVSMSHQSFAGRASPTFGVFGRASFDSAAMDEESRASVASFGPPTGLRSSKSMNDLALGTSGQGVSDSSVTLMRMSNSVTQSVDESASVSSSTSRCPCRFCGRKFATPARLDKHEKICEHVFGRSHPCAARPERPRAYSGMSDDQPPPTATSDTRVVGGGPGVRGPVQCQHCGRSFSHPDKLGKHEPVCLSVFKPSSRRKQTPTTAQSSARERSVSAHNISSETAAGCSDKDSSLRTVVGSRRERRNRCEMISCDMVALEPPSDDREKTRRNTAMRMERFRNVVIEPGRQPVVDRVSSACQSDQSASMLPPAGCHRSSRSFVSVLSSNSSRVDESTTSSSFGRSSLEFQYNLLKEQIRSCSARLKQRRGSESWTTRDS